MKENTGSINAQVPVDVATFLLNEKRVDLQLIEARHRVSVMLIPNVHLETPNYTVTRMRHDDLNKTEPLPASYNLVEAPAEEQKPAAGTAETAPPRPEAAVKGITPAQPAPVPVAREARPEPQPQAVSVAETSIIGKIFGLFKRKPAAEAPLLEEARPPVAPGPRRRHERGEREGPRRDREDRPMQPGGQRYRQDQPQRPHGSRDGGRPGGEQQRHEHRRPEPPRHEHPQQQRQQPRRDLAQADTRPPSNAQHPGREQGEQQREGRGRRRRRGRDRYDQRQEGAGSGRPPAQAQQQAQRQPVRPESEHSVPPAAAAANVAPAAVGMMAEAAAPAAVSHQPPPSFDTERVREIEPRETAPAQPVLTGPGIAPAEPVRIEWPSDLMQVESDPTKVSTVQEQEAVQQSLPRPKRVRQPAQPVIEEPLVQIETGQTGAEPGSSDPKAKVTSLPG